MIPPSHRRLVLRATTSRPDQRNIILLLDIETLLTAFGRREPTNSRSRHLRRRFFIDGRSLRRNRERDCGQALPAYGLTGILVGRYKMPLIQQISTHADTVRMSHQRTTWCSASRESGGTGRRARLRISWVTVGVQVPPLAPSERPSVAPTIFRMRRTRADL